MAVKELMQSVLDLRGLDLVTPVDLLTNGHSPYAKNFRLYAQQADDRRVAVSSRKGPGFYINPLSEALSDVNTAVLGASIAKVGVSTGIHVQPVTATATGRISRIDLSVYNADAASGPLIIELWSDNAGLPYKLLSTSSILGGSISGAAAYRTARFLNAPKFTIGDKYYIVTYIQDDGKNTYTLSTTTSGTKAYTTNSLLSNMVQTTYALNYKVYVSPDGKFKGWYRFNRDNGANVTLLAYGTQMYKLDEATHALISIATGLNTNATEYSFASSDNKVFWVNGYDQLKAWNGTTIETITDTELPILSQIIFHKDLLMGIPASEPDKLVWSQGPGEPAFDPTGVTPTPVNQQWYYSWRSVDYWYIPRPHSGSPITGIVSFQDSLTIFTQDMKYIFSGFDLGNFNLRESTGAKGALSHHGIASDANSIYFVGNDGFYEFNGSKDTKISANINPLFDACGQKDKISVVIWNNEVRFYMASQGSSVNDSCIVYNKDLNEIQYDTETYVDSAIYYGDADDNGELVEISSLYPCAFLADQDYNSLGAPIDFEYRLKYDSMKSPAQRKRIRRFYPLMQGTGPGFNTELQMDKDFEDSPRTQYVMTVTSGIPLGQFVLNQDITGGGSSFKLTRINTSGYANYWQLRVKRRGVNNVVAFIGAQYSYKTKRL